MPYQGTMQAIGQHLASCLHSLSFHTAVTNDEVIHLDDDGHDESATGRHHDGMADVQYRRIIEIRDDGRMDERDESPEEEHHLNFDRFPTPNLDSSTDGDDETVHFPEVVFASDVYGNSDTDGDDVVIDSVYGDDELSINEDLAKNKVQFSVKSHLNKGDGTPRNPDSDDKPITLSNWTLKRRDRYTNRVALAGIYDGREWGTSYVAERLDARTVRVESGTIYQLDGYPSVAHMKGQEFEKSFVRKFSFGFPSDWQQLVNSQTLSNNNMS
ncbi:hypothetical protein SeLEV6574_g07575 [Synchytrium endobioticum]|nr:hypothetical protein SeLEV6574_g07575 [Synchytrium endobioticum]